ncbi:hypothetical protein ACHWQZ_G008975 [Mnemiopsis leidyi]
MNGESRVKTMMMLLTLSLCLLPQGEASCGRTNVAREGEATQVDTLYFSGHELSASRAIDGDNSGREDEENTWDMSHTASAGEDAWWLLTLERVIFICEIKVYNRAERNQDRLDGVKIWVGVGLTR